MQHLTEFAINHWTLVVAFVVVLGILIASMSMTAGGVTPQAAVILINRDGAVAIDVRPSEEYTSGHIIDAIHLPLADMAGAADRLKKHAGRPLVVYCASGAQSGRAVRALKQLGFEQVHALKGGLAAWRGDNLPITSS